MNSVRIAHFFDVIKKELILEDQSDFPPVVLDSNRVKQEYYCKEELDLTWDERDNINGTNQVNYYFSNDLPYKLGFPVVVIERLSNEVIAKYISTVQREIELKNSVTLKRRKKDVFQYYHKFCTRCETIEPSKQKTQKCRNCNIKWNYECKKCSRQLPSHRGLIKHLENKCTDKQYHFACFKCNYKSTFRYKVNAHLKGVHSIRDSRHLIKKIKIENDQNDVGIMTKLHKCSKCGKQFEKLPSLLRHVQICGQANYNSISYAATTYGVKDKCFHYCVKCNQAVKNDGIGRFHEKKCRNCHLKCSFKCKQCNKISQTYSSIADHMKTKHIDPKNVFKCPECHYKTHAIVHLAIHFRKSHFIDSQECPQCRKKYKNRTSFNNHSRLCQKEPNFQCDDCSHRSKSKQALRVHIFQVHTTGNEIDCHQCGKTLKNNKCLKVHLKYCKKEPRHQCNICSYKTKYEYDLTSHHKSIHCNAQKKETCPKCATKLKNKNSLRSHLRRCGKFPELSCNYCHRLFKGKQGKISLTRHIIQLHSEDLPYLHCDDCLYKTKFKGDLAKHVIIHLLSVKK